MKTFPQGFTQQLRIRTRVLLVESPKLYPFKIEENMRNQYARRRIDILGEPLAKRITTIFCQQGMEDAQWNTFQMTVGP